jgi:hypothetical protein
MGIKMPRLTFEKGFVDSLPQRVKNSSGHFL